MELLKQKKVRTSGPLINYVNMLDKVLCIEDNHLLQFVLKRMLEESDFADEIISAYNGKEALTYYKNLIHEDPQSYPDLIFLDLRMPVMGGIEFLDKFEGQFLEMFPKTKVVVLSSSTDLVKKTQEKQHTLILDYLMKPVSMARFNNMKEYLRESMRITA